MGVFSDGSYGTAKGVMYSFPVLIDPTGKWKIVQDLPISDFAREKMDATGKELCEERDEAMEVCKA
jgi:malate/lactate dehydrogenase